MPSGLTKETQEVLTPKRFLDEARLDPDRARIARWLIIILAGTIALHVGTAVYFNGIGNTVAADNMSRVFNVWTPVISGLAGGATTFYFTKQ